MVTLTIRPYEGTQDLQPIADLINLCINHDQEDGYRTAADLHQAFTAPDCNPTEDVRILENHRGDILGYATLSTPDPSESDTAAIGHLAFWLHPKMRGSGLEQDILTWAGDRTRAIANSQCCGAKLRVFCRDHRQDLTTLYTQEGFTFERSFLRMARSLEEPVPEATLPEGFRLLVGEEIDSMAWVDMHNQTFIDHWNFHPLTVEQVNHYVANPNYQPELDLVAIAPDGTYAAFCCGQVCTEENQLSQRQEGWINLLGTRRGYRRMGLARTMLLLGLQRLQAASLTTALLAVDSQNPNQAYELYESIGFRQRSAFLGYVKSLC